MIRVTLIVPIRDLHDMTNQMLRSVNVSDWEKELVKTIIIDNSVKAPYQPPSFGQLQEITVHKPTQELTVTDSWNTGLELAYETNPTHIGILNNDLILGECILPVLASVQLITSGFVSPRMFNLDDVALFEYCREMRLIHYFDAIRFMKENKKFEGSFIFSDTSHFKVMGPFDNQFGLNYQDCDYAKRMDERLIKRFRCMCTSCLHLISCTKHEKYPTEHELAHADASDRVNFTKKWDD